MEEHPRGKKTSKRERELKAVIGLQEITIRNLINSLQEKAKSVKELNETVKLAQAFSAVTKDSQDYGSDAEDTSDEISNSDVTSEYEFSLTKPQVLLFFFFTFINVLFSSLFFFSLLIRKHFLRK